MLSNQVRVKFLVAVLCISSSRSLPAEFSARLDNVMCPNYELDESAMEKYFDFAMDYFKKEINDAVDTNPFCMVYVSPMAYMKYTLLHQYVGSNCTDIDKKCDAIRLFSINFQNKSNNYPPMYEESFRLFIDKREYLNCDRQPFKGLEAISEKRRIFKNQWVKVFPNAIVYMDSNAILRDITWSQFYNSCSNFYDIFTTQTGKEVRVPYTTLNARFQSGKLRDIKAEFITIPLGDSVNDVISIIIVIPSAPVKDINDFGLKLISHVDYQNFFNSIGVKERAVALPPVSYGTLFKKTSENETIGFLFLNSMEILSNTTTNSCNGKYNQNSADIFKINRPFIIFATWKKTIIAAGIMTKVYTD